MSENTPDVIVVGAGLAGLVSTLELLRSGHTVLLLDRCQPQEIGGLAREAFGGMFMVDSPEQRRSRIPDNERWRLRIGCGSPSSTLRTFGLGAGPSSTSRVRATTSAAGCASSA